LAKEVDWKERMVSKLQWFITFKGQNSIENHLYFECHFKKAEFYICYREQKEW